MIRNTRSELTIILNFHLVMTIVFKIFDTFLKLQTNLKSMFVALSEK